MVMVTEDPFKAYKEYGEEKGYDLRWLEKRDVWGRQLDSSDKRGGLLLQDIDAGTAADAPDESYNMTGRTRGSVAASRRPAHWCISRPHEVRYLAAKRLGAIRRGCRTAVVVRHGHSLGDG